MMIIKFFLFSGIILLIFIFLIFGILKVDITNVLLFSGIVLLFLLFSGGFFEAPWVPTRKKDFDRIATIGKLKKGMVFCDIGSGTGEMLFYLSNKYNVNCIGIEIAPMLYLYSKFKSLFYKNVKIMYGNFYKYDLSKADIVYIFQMPHHSNNLKRKISKELGEDSMLISSRWPIKGYNPIQVNEISGEVTYFLYNKKSTQN